MFHVNILSEKKEKYTMFKNRYYAKEAAISASLEDYVIKNCAEYYYICVRVPIPFRSRYLAKTFISLYCPIYSIVRRGNRYYAYIPIELYDYLVEIHEDERDYIITMKGAVSYAKEGEH